MNSKERTIVTKLVTLLNQIPAGQDGSGTKTASAIGMIQAHYDFKQARTATRLILNGLLEHSLHLDDTDPVDILTCFEQWIEERKKAEWQGHPPDFWYYWLEYLREEDGTPETDDD